MLVKFYHFHIFGVKIKKYRKPPTSNPLGKSTIFDGSFFLEVLDFFPYLFEYLFVSLLEEIAFQAASFSLMMRADSFKEGTVMRKKPGLPWPNGKLPLKKTLSQKGLVRWWLER